MTMQFETAPIPRSRGRPRGELYNSVAAAVTSDRWNAIVIRCPEGGSLHDFRNQLYAAMIARGIRLGTMKNSTNNTVLAWYGGGNREEWRG